MPSKRAVDVPTAFDILRTGACACSKSVCRRKKHINEDGRAHMSIIRMVGNYSSKKQLDIGAYGIAESQLPLVSLATPEAIISGSGVPSNCDGNKINLL